MGHDGNDKMDADGMMGQRHLLCAVSVVMRITAEVRLLVMIGPFD
jgi:hypothetical protein